MDRARAKQKTFLRKRTILIAVAALAAVAIVATLLSVDFTSRRIDSDKISIEAVKRGTMEIKVSANGELQSDNIEQLASEVQGRVAKLHLKPGARVEVGQLLVEMDNPQLVTAAEEAQSAWEGSVKELQAAKAQLQTSMLNQEGVQVQAKFALDRSRLQLEAESRLIDQKIISDIDYKRTQLNVRQAEKLYQIETKRLDEIRANINVQLAVSEARVSQFAQALERARNQVANLKIVAGIAGVVQAIDVEVGQQLLPGGSVGRIAQQDDLYAELKVAAREAADVRLGQRVLIDTRSGIVEGAVSRIDPGVTNGIVIVDVALQGDLPTGGRPQLQVEGTIYIQTLPNAMYVGKPAFVKSDSVISVYKLDSSGRYAERSQIKVGKVSVNSVQVLQGLDVGDRIITSETGEWQDQERILLN
jgi:HlyD family secretion protein